MNDVARIMCTVGSVVRKDDAILFVRQTYGNFKNMWTLPWGLIDGQSGHEGGIDTPEKAACREVLEEGGITVSVRSLIAVQNQVSKKEIYMLMFVFLCDYLGGIPKPDMQETSESVFLEKKALADVKDECDRYCYWIANRVFDNDFNELVLNNDSPYNPHAGFY